MAVRSGLLTPWLGTETRTIISPTWRRPARSWRATPNIDMVRVGCVGDVGNFLDTTTDFDMSVVGAFEGEMVYVREEWEPTWVFYGLYVRAHCATLQWYSKHGNEMLECYLWPGENSEG